MIERLDAEGDAELRRELAAELRHLALRQRQSLEKRGDLINPAETSIDERHVEVFNRTLADTDSEVRLLLARCAGDLGDGSSVPSVVDQLRDDDPSIRLAAVSSLGEIGGVDSIKALGDLVRSGQESEDIRLAALTQLEELAAKKITSGPDRHFDPLEGSVSASPHESRVARAGLVATLKGVEQEESDDDLLRLKASDVRAYVESGVDT